MSGVRAAAFIVFALAGCLPVRAGTVCNGLPATIHAVSSTRPLVVFGTLGSDVIVVDSDGVPPTDKVWVWGDDGNDTICIRTDDSVVWGGPGDDWISGGSSEDWLKGQDGRDTIYGNGGHDVLWGGAAKDHLYGGSGDDELRGDTGEDELDCGPGLDFGAGEAVEVIVNCEAVLP